MGYKVKLVYTLLRFSATNSEYTQQKPNCVINKNMFTMKPANLENGRSGLGPIVTQCTITYWRVIDERGKGM